AKAWQSAGMNAVKARRAQKSLRLSLHQAHPAVLLLTCGWAGHLPVVGKNTHLGSLSVSLATPFLMWPWAVQGNYLAITLTALIATWLGFAALMSVDRRQ